MAPAAPVDRTLVQIRKHVGTLLGCTSCPDMIGPVVSGRPVVSKIMMIGQAPGAREGALGQPFAWTAGKTLFKWYARAGLDEESFRSRVYIAAVCRCYPGKAKKTGDRVPSPIEITRCSRHLRAEVALLQPELIIPVGKLAISQLFPEQPQLVDVVGPLRRTTWFDRPVEVLALPHPSGLSTWYRVEPGISLLGQALGNLATHPAWQQIIADATKERT